MKSLLYIEWLKNKKYTTFWLLIGLFAFLFFTWAVALSEGLMSISKMLSSSFAFPSVWANLGHLYSWFVIFLSVLAIISICNEFTFKTHRQHIIDGMQRLDFLHAKILWLLAISVITSVFYVFVTLLIGVLQGGGNPLTSAYYFFYVLLHTFNYVLFATCLSFFLKRSGLTIIILIAYFLFETVIGAFISHQFNSHIGDLMPLQTTDDLLSLPAAKAVIGMMGIQDQGYEDAVHIAVALGWIVLYYIILRQKMLKSDL